MASASNPIILYDGVCGLCNRLVQFLLKRDRIGLRFVVPRSCHLEQELQPESRDDRE